MRKSESYNQKEKIFRILLILFILPLILLSGWFGYTIYKLSSERAQLKKDYSEVNNIKHGILSVDKWRDDIIEIVSNQIDDFELSGMQQDTLLSEINKILNKLISQADEMINEKQKNIGGKLKKFTFNTFVNVDKIRAKVPEFSQTIIDQIKAPRSKRKLKFLAQDKLGDLASQTHDSLIINSRYEQIISQYNAKNVDEFNKTITDRTEIIQQKAYNFMFMMLGVMLLFLLIWFFIRKMPVLHSPFFIMSVLLAMVFLLIGLAAPMIEIDARIPEMKFMIIGKNIQFHDQVLFYQSKSIIDVVKILITTGKPDSIFVGFLILLFSIVFPIAKLLSTKVVLLGTQKWRENKIIKFFAFKSGKWSMADVMVIAIFMAYIGFKGILDSELGKMNVDMNTDRIASIATNKTSLQPGFILFIAFVLFGLILSVILKGISSKNKITDNASIN